MVRMLLPTAVSLLPQRVRLPLLRLPLWAACVTPGSPSLRPTHHHTSSILTPSRRSSKSTRSSTRLRTFSRWRTALTRMARAQLRHGSALRPSIS